MDKADLLLALPGGGGQANFRAVVRTRSVWLCCALQRKGWGATETQSRGQGRLPGGNNVSSGTLRMTRT